jgi:hypothetical protein
VLLQVAREEDLLEIQRLNEDHADALNELEKMKMGRPLEQLMFEEQKMIIINVCSPLFYYYSKFTFLLTNTLNNFATQLTTHTTHDTRYTIHDTHDCMRQEHEQQLLFFMNKVENLQNQLKALQSVQQSSPMPNQAAVVSFFCSEVAQF